MAPQDFSKRLHPTIIITSGDEVPGGAISRHSAWDPTHSSVRDSITRHAAAILVMYDCSVSFDNDYSAMASD